MHCPHAGRSRRQFLGWLGVGVAALATGCAGPDQPPAPADGAAPAGSSGATPPSAGEGPPPTTGSAVGSATRPTRITGEKQLVYGGPTGTKNVVMTVDDGFCADCVKGYVDFAQRTGIHLTFCPNGVYAREWAPHAPVLRPMIEAGQIQLMNHTYDHLDLTKMTPAAVRADLDRNDEWIQRTFGTTTAPYFRPPFGKHNPAVAEAAAQSGYQVTTLWNGSLSDSTVITPQYLMQMAQRYLQGGNIVIGHANHPAVLGLFDQILDLIKQRGLHPVTMDEMFGTRRPALQH